MNDQPHQIQYNRYPQRNQQKLDIIFIEIVQKVDWEYEKYAEYVEEVMFVEHGDSRPR